MKLSKKVSGLRRKGQALKLLVGKDKKSAASTVAVYGTSTIIGKVNMK